MIRLRIAEDGDQQRLIEFVHDHWSPGHLFTRRPEVFSWQHLEPSGRLNMVLAEQTDHPDRPVMGVLGFIPMGRFSPPLGDDDLMLAIWKVRDDGAPPGLGLQLLKFLVGQLSPRLVAAIGTSEVVRPIYTALGYTVGRLHHSAVFHPDRRGSLRIASGVPDRAFVPPAVTTEDPELVRLDESAPAALRETVATVASQGRPAKDWNYIVHRYLRHPWYRYTVSGVLRGGQLSSVVVWRAVEARDSRVLRIVDIIGDPEWLGEGRSAIQRAVIDAGAEYIDLMQWGIDEEWLDELGYVSPSTVPGFVLPNYFAPFEARNVEVELAFKAFDADQRPVRLYRADSDQDRPNLESELALDH